jgi:hypothetical protein
MSNGEEIIVVIGQMTQGRPSRGQWNLVFTSRRIIALKTGSAADVIGKAMVAGFGVTEGIDPESKKLAQMSLDQILEAKYEKIIYPFETIDSLTIRIARMMASVVVIAQKGKKPIKYSGPRTEVLKAQEKKGKLLECGVRVV